MAIFKHPIALFCVLTLSLSLIACSNIHQSSDTDHHVNQQPDYHVGPIKTRKLLSQYPSFANAKASDPTKITELEILDLANQLNNRKLVVVFGTWCHDSQREVPRLLNLLEAVRKQHPEIQFELELIATAPYQFRSKALIKKFELTAVPTIMLFDNDQEMGRVVEHATVNLAADIVNMKL